MVNIGDNIRRFRKGNGITASFVAGKLNKKIGWLTQRELGQRAITVPDLLLISGVLGVNPAIFLTENFGKNEVGEACNGRN
jgi:transcriptional regulator with XRE-family HTH domain